LTAAEVLSTDAGREDNFRADPSIPTGSATLEDYKGSGYDRGHMCPAADLHWSAQAMDDSFYLSNMSPQEGSFNRGIWADLEAVVRTFAVQNGEICVVTGPVLTDGPYKTIGKNKVSVPNYYYKVILDYSGKETKAIAFLLPNEGTKKDLDEFVTTVDEVERITGLDFFPQLPDKEEEALESTYDITLWDFSDFSVSKMAKKYGYDLDSLEIGSFAIEKTVAEPEGLIQTVQYYLYLWFAETKEDIIQEGKDFYNKKIAKFIEELKSN
ncbi:MAG: DNA/RNA non-specific endonuclease, partial [Sphaerochaetaceae bacterium]|nr:DNA/RNA non-specific endonuclease [Sphaerochaetaceae bacterium]